MPDESRAVVTWSVKVMAVAGRWAERRWARRAMVIACMLTPSWLGSSPRQLPAAEPRTVPIVFAVDASFREDGHWRAQLNHLLAHASRYYGTRFGLRFDLADIVSWDAHGDSLEAQLDRLRAQVRAAPGRILVGLTAERPRAAAGYGLASYQDAALVIAMAVTDGRLGDGFLHELAHIFGALDIRPGSGLMSAGQADIELDQVNAHLVALHRGRTFSPDLFPLPPEALDAALDLYREVASRAPQEATLAAAQIAIEKSDYAQALASASEVLAADPRHADALNLRGIALRRLGRVDEAVASYRAALEHRPQTAQVHYNLGIALEKQGESNDALASYRRAVELQPGHARALSNLARLYAQQGEAALAIACAGRALELAPGFAEARVNLALGYLKAGDIARAQSEAGLALAVNPKLAGAHEVLGVAWLASGRPEDARRSLQAAAALEPGEPRFRQQLAHAWNALGDRDRAKWALEEALRLHPDYLPALVDLADVYLQLEQREEALRTFLRIIALKPDDARSHNNVAVLYFRLGDLTRARAHVNRARELGLAPHPDFLAALEAAERGRKKAPRFYGGVFVRASWQAWS